MGNDTNNGCTNDSTNDTAPIFIVGYGTFIPNQEVLKSSNIQVCKIHHFRRIWTGETIFPFVLKDPTFQGFYGLVFQVSRNRLAKLDFYEGVDQGMFTRDSIEVELLSGELLSASIYVPTSKTISEYNLSYASDPEDLWMEEIRKNEEICALFPQLIQKIE
ncbi:MAG: gamma-glutamylcyclotransferase family protein [Promethearchaeota archaeon]